LLGGKRPEQVEVAYELKNVSREPHSFCTLAEDFRSRGEQLLNAGYGIVGVYHSHPRGGTRLSQADLLGMTFAGIILVVACEGGQAVFAAYRVANRQCSELTIRVVGDEYPADDPALVFARGEGDRMPGAGSAIPRGRAEQRAKADGGRDAGCSGFGDSARGRC
jgi:proteasome lid subunit RPN8/RPN11